jgi:hypothetical protein
MHIVTNYQNEPAKRTFKTNRRNLRGSVRLDRKPLTYPKGKGDSEIYQVTG